MDSVAEDTAAECADVSNAEVYRDLKGGGMCHCSLLLSTPPSPFLRLTIGANHTPYDLVVVGGGIVGMATAREVALRHPTMRIAVVEKERKLGGSSILNGHIPVTPHESLGMRLHPVLLLWGLTPPLL